MRRPRLPFRRSEAPTLVQERAAVVEEEELPPPPPPPPPRRPLLWPWLLLLLLLVAGGLVAAWLLTRDDDGGGARRVRAVVPSVVGRSRDSAVQAVRDAGLVPKAFVVSSSREKGTVVAQAPSAGARVARGASVRLNVSNGSGGAAVPPPPPPAPPPPPPAPPPPPPAAPPPPPPPGPTKPPTVTVPDVTSSRQEAAQRRLNSAGLKAGVVYVSSDEPQGTVVSEAPEAGTTQKRGKRVQLNVSLGPNPGPQRAVPDVTGLSAAVAQNRLRAAGFEVQTLPQGVTDPAQVGKVVDEQPSGGRRVPAGSTVTIYVGRPA